MKLTRIFVADHSDDGLWSVHLEKEKQNEFDKFFDLMNDVEWLHDFFDRNKADLTSGYFGNITIGNAAMQTLDELAEMEDTLYEFAEMGFRNRGNKLQHLFKPLNNFEYAINTLQKTKARINKGWLRVYAIRLAENCYLVTGGAIKLTQDMKRDHLQQELKKLELVKTFLHNNGIEYPEDLNLFHDE